MPLEPLKHRNRRRVIAGAAPAVAAAAVAAIALAASALAANRGSSAAPGAGAQTSALTSEAPAAPAAPPPAGTLSTLPYTFANTLGQTVGSPEFMGVSAFNGTVYISNTINNSLSSENAGTEVQHVVGTGIAFGDNGDGGAASAATLYQPAGTAEDAAGNVYIADLGDNMVRKVDVGTGVITRFAGTGVAGDKRQGNLATGAELHGPQAVAVDAAGDVFIADTVNNRVVEVLPDGKWSDFAGTGKAGYSGDGGKATLADLTEPAGVAVDAKGNVYIADTSNNVIRRVDASTGVITTVAGNYAADQVEVPLADGTRTVFHQGQGGFAGDGGPATAARLNEPEGVALDSAGDLFIADAANNAIREVTPDGNIFTVVNHAGTNGAAPTAGAAVSGPATSSGLSAPASVAVDNSTATVYVANTRSNQVAAVTGLAQSGDAAGPVAPASAS